MQFKFLVGFWQHRSLIVGFSKRELESRYKGALLGRLWVLINHLSLIAIYTFVFSVVLKTRLKTGQGTLGLDFALWLYCGLLPWLALNEAMSISAKDVVSKATFVKKIVFPVEILPVATVLTALFNMAIGLVMLLIGMVLFGTGLHWTDLLIIPVFVPLFLFMSGLTLFISSLGVYFRDLGQLVGLLSMVWLYATPIMYTSDMIPKNFQALFILNPLVDLVGYFRDALFWGRFPNLWFLLWFLLGSLAMYAIGHYTFKGTKRGFADVL